MNHKIKTIKKLTESIKNALESIKMLSGKNSWSQIFHCRMLLCGKILRENDLLHYYNLFDYQLQKAQNNIEERKQIGKVMGHINTHRMDADSALVGLNVNPTLLSNFVFPSEEEIKKESNKSIARDSVSRSFHSKENQLTAKRLRQTIIMWSEMEDESQIIKALKSFAIFLKRSDMDNVKKGDLLIVCMRNEKQEDQIIFARFIRYINETTVSIYTDLVEKDVFNVHSSLVFPLSESMKEKMDSVEKMRELVCDAISFYQSMNVYFVQKVKEHLSSATEDNYLLNLIINLLPKFDFSPSTFYIHEQSERTSRIRLNTISSNKDVPQTARVKSGTISSNSFSNSSGPLSIISPRNNKKSSNPTPFSSSYQPNSKSSLLSRSPSNEREGEDLIDAIITPRKTNINTETNHSEPITPNTPSIQSNTRILNFIYSQKLIFNLQDLRELKELGERVNSLIKTPSATFYSHILQECQSKTINYLSKIDTKSFFAPFRAQTIRNLNRFPEKSAYNCSQILQTIYLIIEHQLSMLTENCERIKTGISKNELSHFWHSLINKKVSSFLSRNNYDDEASPYDYIKTRPKSIEAIKKNKEILEELIKEFNEKKGESRIALLIDKLKKQIYPKINVFIHQIRLVLCHELKAPTFSTFTELDEKLQKLQYFQTDTDLSNLLKDLTYLSEMKRLEEDTHEKQLHIVPVNGLVYGVFVRNLNEMNTVIELWGKDKRFIENVVEDD